MTSDVSKIITALDIVITNHTTQVQYVHQIKNVNEEDVFITNALFPSAFAFKIKI